MKEIAIQLHRQWHSAWSSDFCRKIPTKFFAFYIFQDSWTRRALVLLLSSTWILRWLRTFQLNKKSVFGFLRHAVDFIFLFTFLRAGIKLVKRQRSTWICSVFSDFSKQGLNSTPALNSSPWSQSWTRCRILFLTWLWQFNNTCLHFFYGIPTDRIPSKSPDSCQTSLEQNHITEVENTVSGLANSPLINSYPT